MKRIFSVLIICMMLLTGCGTNRDIPKSPDITNTTNNKQDESSTDKYDLIYEYVTEDIKATLRNPSSLQVNDFKINDDLSMDIDDTYYCNILIDYSAQNGFGGFNRETVEKFIVIEKGKNEINDISEGEYLNEFYMFKYGEGLSSIDDSIPFDLAFTTKTYNSILQDMRRTNEKVSTFEYNDGTKEIEFIDYFDDYEGSVTIAFDANTQQFYNMTFFWSEDQMLYMNGDVIYLGKGQSATNDDILSVVKQINEALGFDHDKINTMDESPFETYSCVWNMNGAASMTVRWSVNQETGQVSSFNVTLNNLVNESA